MRYPKLRFEVPGDSRAGPWLGRVIKMDVLKSLRRIVPGSIKRRVRELIVEGSKKAAGLDENSILGCLHSPLLRPPCGQEKLIWNGSGPSGRSVNDPLPVPPTHLRMGYATSSDEEFLECGRLSCTSIRGIMEREGIRLTQGTAAMDWGCASGRVLRYFAAEARECEFWGLDPDGAHLAWAKENLSPPFKFLTCTAYPHLPFEDGKFRMIYGLSVFTHIIQLLDVWILEIRRILAPGGYALFSIHDENSWRYFSESKERPFWLRNEDMTKPLAHDMMVYGSGRWNEVFTFFKTDWIRREWGNYFNVVSFEPFAEGYQTMVVLRKE